MIAGVFSSVHRGGLVSWALVRVLGFVLYWLAFLGCLRFTKLLQAKMPGGVWG